VFLKYRSIEFCDFLPRNFNRDCIGPLCDEISRRGRPKAVIKQLGKHYGIMALRHRHNDGYIIRSLWHGTLSKLEEMASEVGANVVWLA
jgi:hypothetical protein